MAGEFIVNVSAKIFLNKEDYHLIKNVTLPTENETTQIDHIIVSKYGVFVVETKNMKGWIFGRADQKTWTQVIFKNKTKFQNPLHQNYKHVKTLESIFGLRGDQLYSLIVFVGDSKFKTEMPENVTYGSGYIRYIKSKKNPVLSSTEVQELIQKIGEERLSASIKTHQQHIKQIKKTVREKQTDINCPKCDSSMVMREARTGTNQGKKFWGCSNFPKCRGIVNIP